MKTIKELLNYIINRHKKGADCKVLGLGSFSVVWDINGKAYKLTSELSYEQAIAMREKNNKLFKQGVNVPEIGDIDLFNVNNDATMANLKRFYDLYEEDDFYRILADYANGFDKNDGQHEIV